MLYSTHLEPEEFVETVFKKQLNITARVYVLNNGIAGIVYMCHDDENLYYLDRLFPAKEKESVYEELDPYEIHQELYAKVNLDESLRRKQIQI